MKFMLGMRALFLSLILIVAFIGDIAAANTDPNVTWPLCGRITENPPAGWVDTDGCPVVRAGDPAFSDEPLSSTFGPRPLASESGRYDFHRGVDIATPIGTPIFAITDGTIEIAGVDPSYSDPLVKVRHFRPGEVSCNAGGCYHAFYLHLSSWVVAEDDVVVKGQLLGYTGASASGFEHVHFEVRDAPDFDVFSAWSRDAIHPLSVVPYSAPNNTTFQFNNVDLSNPVAGIVDLTLSSNRFDLASVSLTLRDGAQQVIPQSGNTPNVNGYFVNPPFFDMELWNFQYSHKNSSSIPWANFGAGGVDECPYYVDHAASYDANIHMDQQHPSDSLEGLFNGLHIRTQKYWPSDVDDYTVDLEFQALEGNAACVQVTAVFVSGDTASAEWGSCTVASQALAVRGPYLQMQTDEGITIHWRTDILTDSVVRYGSAADNLTNTVTVTGSRTEHEVQLVGLSTAQKFWYSIGDSSGTIAGDASYHFSTAPMRGQSADTRVWVLGDSGTANDNARAVRDAYKTWTASDPANLLLMLGDNAYNDGTDAEYQAAVFEIYPEVLRQLPLFSTLGNHDGHSADSSTQSGPYYDIHNLPKNGEIGGLASGTEAYYSFDYANIHFVNLDSYETDRSTNGTMLTWLESDLALNTQPWVIAIWHHPPYTKGSHDSDTEGQLIDMRENALPILENWGVDLVMSGHSHSYERSYLLDGHYGNSLSLDPVANVLNPGDGSELGDGVYEKPDIIAASHEGAVYAVAGSSGKKSAAPLDHPAMFVSVSELGSLVVDVSGNRMNVTFINENATVLDEFSISKGPDVEPPLISAATAEDATHVKLDFDEALDALEATDTNNYTIAGLAVNQVDLLVGDRSVRLTTSAMTPEANYTLVVNNVQDAALNTIAPNSSISFDFFDIMTTSFQDGLAPDPAYFGTMDAYIREASPDTLYGQNTDLQVDGSEPSGSATDMSIVLGWDISSIPANAIVQEANFELEVTNVSNGSYSCYALLSTWNQAEVSWNQASSGLPWGTAGAANSSDRGSQVLCNVSAGSTGKLTVNLAGDGLAQVQAWVSDPVSNHGMIITDPSTGDGADFHSSESLTAMARPKLNVTYRVPVVIENIVPVAGFGDSCTELDCTFTDTSTDSDGTVTGWSWSFGDGSSSTSQNPSHSYASDGDYTVTLTVTDNDGGTDLTSTLVSVAQLVDPVAGFDDSCTELDCTFTDTSSDSDGNITGWSWNFGDGNSSTAQNPSHSYASSGDFSVSLTVTDNDGRTDQVSTLVSVAQLVDPVAGFSNSCTELDCSFTDASTDSDGNITGWNWSFGDGNSSTAQNPSHSYAASGDYTVSLTVTDNDGRTDQTSTLVSVSQSQAFVDQVAVSDLGGSGNTSGSYTATHADGGATQSITEIESGGKKSKRYSYLQKTWQFNVVPGSMVTLFANAWSSGSSDGDSFAFSWSTNNSNFTDLFTVTSTGSSNLQSALLSGSGTIYIRVRDTDRGQGNRALDTVFVDHLYIRSENGTIPDAPAAPTNLQPTGATPNSISLSWSHPGIDETGFDLQRALSGSGNWSQVASPTAGATSFTDNGLSASTAYDYRIRAGNAGGDSAFSNVATATTDTAPVVTITLSTSQSVKRGIHQVKLTWSNATGGSVDIVRDNVVISTTSNDGRYTDKTGNSGSRTYLYKVCEAGSSVCSAEVAVVF